MCSRPDRFISESISNGWSRNVPGFLVVQRGAAIMG